MVPLQEQKKDAELNAKEPENTRPSELPDFPFLSNENPYTSVSGIR